MILKNTKVSYIEKIKFKWCSYEEEERKAHFENHEEMEWTEPSKKGS